VGTAGTFLGASTHLSPRDVWATGWAYDRDNVPGPLFEHWDGQSWRVVGSPSVSADGTHLVDVASIESRHLWAAGDFYDDQGDPVALLERLCPVRILDAGFSPHSGRVGLGADVAWTVPEADSTSHTVTDASGMELFDSGELEPGSSYTFGFVAAGTYPILDAATASRYTLSVPATAVPGSGGLSTKFTITWSAGAPAPGFVFDIQIRRPGETTFTDWLTDQQMPSATFVPDSGTGTYAFRGRLRNQDNGRASQYSPRVSISVA
jgi:plastocyanin